MASPKVRALCDLDIEHVRIKAPYQSTDQRLQFKLRLGSDNELIVLHIEPCTICYRGTKDVFDNIVFMVDLVEKDASKIVALQKHIVGKLHRATSGKEVVPIMREHRMRLKNHEQCVSLFDGAGHPIALTSFESLAPVRAIVQIDHFWIVKDVCGICCKMMQLQHIGQLVARFQAPLFLVPIPVPVSAAPPPPPPLPQHSRRDGQFAPSVADILDVRKRLKCVGKVYHSHYVPCALSTQ